MKVFLGVPEQYIQAGKNAPVALVIQENGEQFSIQTITGPQSWTDKFEIGKPAMITGPGKRQMEVGEILNSVVAVASPSIGLFGYGELRLIVHKKQFGC